MNALLRVIWFYRNSKQTPSLPLLQTGKLRPQGAGRRLDVSGTAGTLSPASACLIETAIDQREGGQPGHQACLQLKEGEASLLSRRDSGRRGRSYQQKAASILPHFPDVGERHIPKVLTDHNGGGLCSLRVCHPSWLSFLFLSVSPSASILPVFSVIWQAQRPHSLPDCVPGSGMADPGIAQDFTHLLLRVTEVWGVCCMVCQPHA